MRRKTKSKLKGIKIRGPEGECGVIKETDGKACASPKMLGKDTCFKHQHLAQVKRNQDIVNNFVTEERKMETLDECALFFTECINLVRAGIMPTDTGRALAAMMDKLIKIKVFTLKFDPKQIATRTVTREMAAKYAQSLSLDEAKRIVEERQSILHLERKIHEEQATDAIVLKTPEGKEATTRAERNIAQLGRVIEREMDVLRDVVDIDQIIEDETELEKEVENEEI